MCPVSVLELQNPVTMHKLVISRTVVASQCRKQSLACLRLPTWSVNSILRCRFLERGEYMRLRCKNTVQRSENNASAFCLCQHRLGLLKKNGRPSVSCPPSGLHPLSDSLDQQRLETVLVTPSESPSESQHPGHAIGAMPSQHHMLGCLGQKPYRAAPPGRDVLSQLAKT